MPTSDSLRAMLDAWREAVARATEARLRGADVDAHAALARGDELQRSIEAQLGDRASLLALIRRRIEATEAARAETRAGLPGEDPEVLRAEVDSAIEALVRTVSREDSVLAALDEARARLRVHVEGPFIERRADIEKVVDVEALRFLDQVHGQVSAAEARDILRGEVLSLLLASPKWKWFDGGVSERAIRAGREALLRALQRAREATSFSGSGVVAKRAIGAVRPARGRR